MRHIQFVVAIVVLASVVGSALGQDLPQVVPRGPLNGNPVGPAVGPPMGGGVVPPAQGPAAPPAVAEGPPVGTPFDFTTLSDVKWLGRQAPPQLLQDRAVLVLLFAEWCPNCNGWSPQLFADLKQSILRRPVIVLAINNDSSPAGAHAYLKKHGFEAANVFVGYGPDVHQKLGFRNPLYKYALLDPDHKVIASGWAADGVNGVRIDTRFHVAHRINTGDDLGEFSVLAETMSPELQAALWPLELGMTDEATLKRSRESLPDGEQRAFNQAVVDYLDTLLAEIEQLAGGDVAQQIEAYQQAQQLAGMFSASKQSKTAAQYVRFKDGDRQFQRELAAQTAYQNVMAKAASGSPRFRILVKAVAQRYKGTHFGDLAAQAIAARKPDDGE